MGFFAEVVDGREVRRGETFTCAHCNFHFEFRDNLGKFQPPTMCSSEHKPLCQRCAKRAYARGRCEVFDRTLERIEARDRFLMSAGIIL